MSLFKKLSIRDVSELIKVAILSLVFLVKLIAQEDEIKFTHLTVEDGLSLNAVTGILQDSRGFLWFGTYDGLNRYDGYNFKIFLPEASNPHSISSHSIRSLYEDSKGYIWVGTGAGLNRYNWKTEEFRKYLNDPQNPNSISNNIVYSIFEDKTGTLWIGTENGLNKYNTEKDNFTQYNKVNNETNINSLNSVTSIEGDSKGNIWLGTWKGLSGIQKDGKIKHITLPENKNLTSFFYNEISVILEDNDKNLWIGTNGRGLYKYNQNTGKFTNFYTIHSDPNTLSDNSVNAIYQDKHNVLWVGTVNGLNKLDPETNKFTRILRDPLKPLSLINNKIYSIKEDRTGILWVGSDGGISRFYLPYSRFKYFRETKNSANNLGNQYISSLLTDKEGNLWVSAREGLYQIRDVSGQIAGSMNDALRKNKLTNDYIWSIIEDRFGIIWMGTDRGGLTSYNPHTKQFRAYRSSNNEGSISNNGVTSVYEDHNGNIWAGTWRGFNLLDRKTGIFKRYTNVFKNNIIWVFYEDSKRMLWIGTDGSGVSMYNPQNKTFTNFEHDSLKANKITGNRVISIYETRDGVMWFGTIEGLNSYDRNTNKFTNYYTKDGLPSIIINSILEDKKGSLWISTDKGLSKFNRETGIFINYTERNGIKDIEFSPRAQAKASSGDFIYGTKNGLVFFNPDSIEDEKFSAPVVFTDFKIFNESVPITPNGILTESVTTAKFVRIPFNNNVITFEFALLDFFKVKRNTFQFKLEGFDKGWNDVGTRNNATYTNLPPGDYKFLVRASTNNGVKDSKQASIYVIIVPSFYQTWWFRIVLGLGILLSTLFVVQRKTRLIQRQNKLLENKVSKRTKDLDKTINDLSLEIVEREKVEEKFKTSLKEKENLLKEKESLLTEKVVLLKEIHHRVKNNLQVISSLLYLNSKKIKDVEALNMFQESQNRIKSIALVHERLYQSKDLSKIDFYEYVSKLTTDLFRSYAVKTEVIRLEINIRDVFIKLDTAIPCGLIINELISNALKYAFPEYEEQNKTGIIKVNFSKTGDELLLIVSDNGIGIPKRINVNKTDSLGLQLVQSLVSQLDGTLEVNIDNGTEFIINLNNS